MGLLRTHPCQYLCLVSITALLSNWVSVSTPLIYTLPHSITPLLGAKGTQMNGEVFHMISFITLFSIWVGVSTPLICELSFYSSFAFYRLSLPPPTQQT